MPTMKDVAKLAGVSHGTVSNVINGVKTVNHDTVIRVEQAMKQLGYRPGRQSPQPAPEKDQYDWGCPA